MWIYFLDIVTSISIDSLSQYLLFTCTGWRAVECDELLQVFFQAGLGSVPLGRLGAPEIGPELRLTAQQTVALVPSGDKKQDLTQRDTT